MFELFCPVFKKSRVDCAFFLFEGSCDGRVNRVRAPHLRLATPSEARRFREAAYHGRWLIYSFTQRLDSDSPTLLHGDGAREGENVPTL